MVVLFIHNSKFKVANEKPDTDALWCYFKASALITENCRWWCLPRWL